MIRVMTYNIHGGRGRDRKRDYRRIGELLKDYEVDIVLLQEMDTRISSNAQKDVDLLQGEHFKYFIAGPTLFSEKGWYGNAIMSRFPVVQESILDISEPGREPRNIMEVFIATDEGLLHVVNTHKGLAKTERGQQLTKLHKLLSRKSDVPLIVGGDINEWHASPAALRELNEILRPLPVGATFPTYMPVFHLDRFWCRPSTAVESCKVIREKRTRIYSDHLPVMVELHI